VREARGTCEGKLAMRWERRARDWARGVGWLTNHRWLLVATCNLGGSWLPMLGAALRRTEVTRPDGSCNTCMCHNSCRQPPESTQEGKTSRARHDHQNHQKDHRQTEHTQPSKPAADPLGLS